MIKKINNIEYCMKFACKYNQMQSISIAEYVAQLRKNDSSSNSAALHRQLTAPMQLSQPQEKAK